MAFGCLTSSPADGQQFSENRRPGLWVPDNIVACMAESCGILYFGGAFQSVRQYFGAFARLDPQSGQSGQGFPRFNNAVYSIAADGAGGGYVVGGFTAVDGVARKYLAHVLADGTLDPSWNPDADNLVIAVAVSGGTVYVAGYFEQIGGHPRIRIAALDAVTGDVRPWNPNCNAVVRDLKVSGNIVYAGGEFTSIGGQLRNRIAALDAVTGDATAWNPNATAEVRALDIAGSIVYAAGQFTGIGGAPRNRIAAIDSSTSAATPWNPNSDGPVYDVVVSGGTVYAGGEFTNIGGQARRSIAALDAVTGAATKWDPQSDRYVIAIARSGSSVYVGGGFTSMGGEARAGIAALDAATGRATEWNPRSGRESGTLALAVSGDSLYVGGYTLSMNELTRRGIAAVDTRTGVDAGFDASLVDGNDYGYVSALAAARDTVYITYYKSLGFPNPTERYGIAALHAKTGAMLWDKPLKGFAQAVAVAGDAVFVGGYFESVDGRSRDHIAALDGATGHLLSWDPGPVPIVFALAADNGTVYVGCDQEIIDGQLIGPVHAYDAVDGRMEWSADAQGFTYALAVEDARVYAAGQFWEVEGAFVDCSMIAVDGATGAATPAPSTGYLTGTSVAISGDTVFMGSISSVGYGQPPYIIAIDARSLDLIDWSPSIPPDSRDFDRVLALAASGGTLYMGGDFDRYYDPDRPIWRLSAFDQLGDMNCDARLDGEDIAPFVLSVTDRSGYDAQNACCPYPKSDMNQSGRTDLADVPAFVTALIGGN